MRTFDERRACVANYMEKIKRRRRRTIATMISVCLVVAILAAVLFVPYDTTPPDVSMYAGSDYYSLIQRLNEATYQKPKYENNFQTLVGNLNFSQGKGSESMGNLTDGFVSNGMPMAPGAPNYGINGDYNNATGESNPAGDRYQEVTDNQVEGVIEADLLKRSDKYAFYLRGLQLSVYSIAGEESCLIGSHSLKAISAQGESSVRDDFNYYAYAEMYLSQDCRTLTAVVQGYNKTAGTCTVLVNLDVSDPANMTEKNRVYFTGDYVSSRMVEGDILLTYNYMVSNDRMNFEEPATFVPQYGTPENMTCIPGENIICPENVSATRYTVVCKVDGESLQVEGSAALLSYSQELYVSEDTIYATHSYTERNQEKFDNNYRQTTMTEITGISYAGESLEILGTITLEGGVKDQYSMDQYEGILRVVTSTTVSYLTETFYDEFVSAARTETKRNVNLYCIDLTRWEIAAEVIGFAPDGEDAQSVRFDGYHAYVCTAEVITFTDPVYFFDLRDLNNITWKDTGTIEGYSTSLINLGEGYLLGIGRGGSSALKIEVYEETEDGVVSVCVYERNAIYSTEYKSYLVDREKNLIGLHILDWNTGFQGYVLLHFNGYKLLEMQVIPMDCYGEGDTRAFIADDYLFVFSDAKENNFRVTQIS